MTKSRLFVFSVLFLSFLLLPALLNAQSKYIKLCKSGIGCVNRGSLDSAILKFNDAINMQPAKWCAYSCKAFANYQNKKYSEALTDITQAITIAPNNQYNYEIRADIYVEKKMYDNAISDYGMAIAKTKSSSSSYYELYFDRGKAYSLNKQYQEAVSDFTQAYTLALKKNYTYTSVYYSRAKANFELGKYAETASDYSLALSTDPDNIYVLYYQGLSYYKLGETDNAKANALKIIELDPTKEICFSGTKLLDIYDFDKRRTIAEKLFKSGVDAYKEQKTIVSRAIANLKLADAFQLLDSALLYTFSDLNEDNDMRDSIKEMMFIIYPLMKEKPAVREAARKYMVQAGTATDEKKYNEALKLWGKASSIAPYYPLADYNRALLWELLGNYEYAISNMKDYIKLSPDATDARSAQDKIYAWEGKLKKEGASNETINTSMLNDIIAENYEPGKYYVALAVGAAAGLQIYKNKSLSDFWDASFPSTKKYSETTHVPLSFDAELIVKPIKYIGVGVFYKTLGGIGSVGVHSETHPQLALPCNQIGGLARLYLQNGDIYRKVDLFLQYGFAQSSLNGYYDVWQSNSLLGPFGMSLSGTGPFRSYGFGFGGKVSKHAYMTMSLDYITAQFDKIKYHIGVCDADPTRIGETGTLKTTTYTINSGVIGDNVTARYNGLQIKWVFGICF
jgi:tetratricopeptide (TPR) repeat protein